MAIFKPKEIINRFTNFDPFVYKNKGFEMVLLDIDNTITVPDIGHLTSEARDFIDSIKKAGMKVLIFSNNNHIRVRSFVGDSGVNWFCGAHKPLPFMYWIACLKYNVKPSKTIMIGDQLLTDILGANLSGCYGIYTKPLQEKDSFLTAINRKIERIIWRSMNEKM